MARFFDLKKVAEGGFGIVHMGKDSQNNNIVVAIKRYKNHDQNGVPYDGVRELIVLRRGQNHPHILQMFDAIHTSSECSIVLEAMTCSLADLLKLKGHLSTETSLGYLCQICCGMKFLHDSNILHRDVKPGNILYKNEILKISDFGSSRFIGGGKSRCHTRRVCTLWYEAPEMLLGEPLYKYTSDIWSVGCVYVEMRTGKPAFATKLPCDFSQLITIFKSRGTPIESTWKNVSNLPDYSKEFPKFKHVTIKEWMQTLFKNKVVETAIDKFELRILKSCLVFNPIYRLDATSICNTLQTRTNAAKPPAITVKPSQPVLLCSSSKKRESNHFIVVEWLIDVCSSLNVSNVTSHFAVFILGYTEKTFVDFQLDMQLLAVSCAIIACKCNESRNISTDEAVRLCNNRHQSHTINKVERQVMQMLSKLSISMTDMPLNRIYKCGVAPDLAPWLDYVTDLCLLNILVDTDDGAMIRACISFAATIQNMNICNESPAKEVSAGTALSPKLPSNDLKSREEKPQNDTASSHSLSNDASQLSNKSQTHTNLAEKNQRVKRKFTCNITKPLSNDLNRCSNCMLLSFSATKLTPLSRVLASEVCYCCLESAKMTQLKPIHDNYPMDEHTCFQYISTLHDHLNDLDCLRKKHTIVFRDYESPLKNQC